MNHHFYYYLNQTKIRPNFLNISFFKKIVVKY